MTSTGGRDRANPQGERRQRNRQSWSSPLFFLVIPAVTTCNGRRGLKLKTKAGTPQKTLTLIVASSST
ncbi:hypothetical protein Q5P01_012189 [Channa striata]|uniref:Uncharacterized protein n=1 Tax=Channa striata TaxID=64152 RepID=A0AA88SQU0_CHASR|nr:hypothetical protein Q5P01_012189 [Channa striata]